MLLNSAFFIFKKSTH